MTDIFKRKLAETLQTSPISPVLKEVGLFAGIFFSVFIISIVFVNANLLYHTVKGFFTEVQASDYQFTNNTSETTGATISVVTAEDQKTTQNILKEDRTMFISSEKQIETSLQNKSYEFSYSRIPPGNRIFISSINVDAPIIDISVASEGKLKKGDFMNELYDGVVKYPSTPEPGSKGNTLIFGHTSYYRWKKNPYGEIFAKIYDLKYGDTIKVAWNGQLYTYEVIDKIITRPENVDKEYMKYTDGEYITLMGCYPLGTDSKRGLIIAKRIKNPKAETNTISMQ